MRKLASADVWMGLKVKIVTDVKQDITTFQTAELATVTLQGQTLQPASKLRNLKYINFIKHSFQQILIKNFIKV